jgi:multiple sugar transport system permease protein
MTAPAIAMEERKPSLLRRATPFILITPVIIYYAIFWLRPVLQLFSSSFVTLDGSIGLDNFVLTFQDPSFWPAIRNTFVFVIFSVTLEFFVAFAVSLLINQKFKGASAFLFVAMIPMALPASAAGAIWQTGFTANGWVNTILFHLGLLPDGQTIFWLAGDTFQMLGLLIILDAWTVIPSVMIILLAGLQTLPREAEEAGYVFGGNYWTVLTKIKIPMMKSSIITAVILRLIAAIQIWQILVIMFGHNRLPTLVERIVYYTDVVPGVTTSPKMASAYTVIVTLIVSLAAIAFLWASGAFKKQGAK